MRLSCLLPLSHISYHMSCMFFSSYFTVNTLHASVSLLLIFFKSHAQLPLLRKIVPWTLQGLTIVIPFQCCPQTVFCTVIDTVVDIVRTENPLNPPTPFTPCRDAALGYLRQVMLLSVCLFVSGSALCLSGCAVVFSYQLWVNHYMSV